MNIQQSSLRCIFCEWAHRWSRIWNTNEWKSSVTVSRALHPLSASTWPRGKMSEGFRLEQSKGSQETCSKYSRLGFISSFKHISPLNMELLLMWCRIHFLAPVTHRPPLYHSVTLHMGTLTKHVTHWRANCTRWTWFYTQTHSCCPL